ncbi:phosphatidylinositide phosphatase SAC2-like isoform X2 [Penaeus chinensis]|uniref:phosphatidylinositide phosphatase SAC2-like isoform X2 n=1 Tax=Penaeus chinensis TaxID=139456 RepID=UPI001FB81B1A|nr:phosphatidylinositide phosphatase SAC2-like isoform X2 [Penaeus chinensis]
MCLHACYGLQAKRAFWNMGQDSLWCDRRTGHFQAKTCWDLASAENPTCLGVIHLLLGKLQIHPDLSPRLVLVSGVREVGSLAEGQRVWCITRVVFLPLNTPPDADFSILPCKKHANHPSSASGEKKLGLPFGDLQQKVALSKTFGTIRSVTSTIKSATVNAAATATGQSKVRRDGRDRDRYERRVLDELSKMFNDSDSFYFSSEADLTSSLQRQSLSSYDKSLPLWRRANDNYFWNRHLLIDLISQEGSSFDVWIVPVIQGFVQIEAVPLDAPISSPDDSVDKDRDHYTLTLISRRSRYRAGTRYKRRGVDEEGYVANYVETEQIVSYSHHRVAFVQVRGSVPVYWSQPGYKYRPPPRLDRDTAETSLAFKKHFEREVSHYDHVSCISLVEQTGKEKVISDAYLNHIFMLDSSDLTFVTFDFHEYCRGMRYENVSVLIEGLEDCISKMLYCWVDKEGTICRQSGVFRVNCIDCLDRTNVVQTAIAKSVLEGQFVKLGMIPPEHPLPTACRSTLQIMWANNGDTISKQYAGTSALKGDFTRTGERRFAGMMKDGMNSANRYYRNHFLDAYRQVAIDVMLGLELSEDQWQEINYVETLLNVASALMPIGPPSYMAEIAPGNEKYLASALYSLSRYYMNRFKDAYRQATIDHLLGNPIREDMITFNPELAGEEEESSMTPEHVKHVIDDCKKLLVPDAETILGAWGLIDADPSTGDPDQTDMDIILVLTRDSYYVAQYDEETDQILRYERVSLIDLEKIEMGPYTCQGMFKQSRPHQCVRFNYLVEGQSGYLHTFRSMNIRFFNNMAITIKSEEEMIESVKAIGETFEVAVQMIGCDVQLVTGKMEKKRSRGRNQLANLLNPIASLTKTSPDTLKTAGTRAFSNMTSGLAKLNPMASLRMKRASHPTVHPAASTFYFQKPTVSVQNGSDVMIQMGGNETYLASCGVLASSLMAPPSPPPRYPSPPIARCHSDSAILHGSVLGRSSIPGVSTNRSPTPEILVSGTGDKNNTPAITPTLGGLSPSLLMQRVRKISHSSDEVDVRDERDAGVLRASSATNLQLHLPSSHSEGHIGGTSTQSTALNAGDHSNPLSPLSALNKEAVLAPFSVLARGVQSLAPGAGRLARGMQSIGANFDPRRLRAQRQRQLEDDPVLTEKKQNCKTQIIQL